MANGKTFTVTEQLNSEEDFDALQEVTAELEQAEAETKKYHDAILDDFAMEDPIAPETLRTYIGKYPSLAVELTDLYHELLLVDQTAAADGIELETKSAVVSSQQDVVFVANALSGSNLRNLAKKLGLPRDCIARWRAERDNIERKFSGVRPSYVSTDLAILEERIERYKRMLEETE